VNKESLSRVLDQLGDCVANKPTPGRMAVLLESIIDNRLTDDEVRRGYIAVRDSVKPWWPSPGEFLALARPPVSSVVVDSEANRLFDLIRDNPGQAYGRHSGEGTFLNRRLIEAAHGRAAGLAFVAAGGSSVFTTMNDRSEPFVRKAFVKAYETARADFGAPLTLDPARLLPAASATPLLTGAAQAHEMGAHERAFRDLMQSLREPNQTRRVDLEARLAELRDQAEQLRESQDGPKKGGEATGAAA
jgi:hypothetical protein